jgi:hypothetical protein
MAWAGAEGIVSKSIPSSPTPMILKLQRMLRGVTEADSADVLGRNSFILLLSNSEDYRCVKGGKVIISLP